MALEEIAAPGNWAMQWAPAETVAVLGLPVSIDGLVAVTKALEVAYGKGLVIRTDQQGADGWIVVARDGHKPDEQEPTPGVR
jgi:hypothetical protein